MQQGKILFLIVVLVLSTGSLVACGESTETTTGHSNTSTTKTSAETTKTTTTPRPTSSGPPLQVALAIDGTARPGRVATEYVEDAAILISSTIERGGGYRVSMFRGSGAQMVLGTIALDPGDPIEKRYEKAAKIYYENFALPLDEVLGQMPLTPEVEKRLAALPAGSAVGEAVREAVEAVRGKPGERWAVIATDGIDDTQGALPLQDVQRTARILRRAVGDVDARGVGIAMVGVGLDRRHTRWSEDGPLTEAWARVCREIQARECQIHADPRLPGPLEGTSAAIIEGV
ncbi:MAG: hypothetical protein M3335_07165 [Actinomycetota bacterium]|nr:hypothetical protein [Actinomycetota bacterium]